MRHRQLNSEKNRANYILFVRKLKHLKNCNKSAWSQWKLFLIYCGTFPFWVAKSASTTSLSHRGGYMYYCHWVTDDITLWWGKLLLRGIQDVSGDQAVFNFVVGVPILRIWSILRYPLWFKKILPIWLPGFASLSGLHTVVFWCSTYWDVTSDNKPLSSFLQLDPRVLVPVNFHTGGFDEMAWLPHALAASFLL